MNLWLKLVAVLAVAVLGFWGCQITKSSVTPSVIDNRLEPLPVPVGLPATDVILETNIQRRANGLGPLTENSKLNAAADFKMRDMFARQYFNHYGPNQTSGIPELLARFDYKYLAAGENLALGDFKNANELVVGWMASPGHRANILNGTYQEIGVAVGCEVFQGRRTIIAVQIFGTPR